MIIPRFIPILFPSPPVLSRALFYFCRNFNYISKSPRLFSPYPPLFRFETDGLPIGVRDSIDRSNDRTTDRPLELYDDRIIREMYFKYLRWRTKSLTRVRFAFEKKKSVTDERYATTVRNVCTYDGTVSISRQYERLTRRRTTK